MKKTTRIFCATILLCSTLFLSACDQQPQTNDPTDPTTVSSADATTTTTTTTAPADKTDPVTTSTKPAAVATRPLTPTNRLSLTELGYDRADSVRVCQRKSAPFRAVTLKKGSAEYEQLFALLNQVQGTYADRSMQGIYGPTYLLQINNGDTRLDELSIAPTELWFGSSQQQEAGENVETTYPSLYTMDEELHAKLMDFFDSLTYTEGL